MLGLIALILGVVDAGARSTDTHTLTVEVIGKGSVKSTSTSGINCGNGSKKCFIAFGVDSVTLKASAPNGWTFDGWSGGCSADPCDVDLTTYDLVTATFSPKSSATQSTLTATYNDTVGKGNISGPETDAGTELYCGTVGTDCTWGPVPTGSTLTVFETPTTDEDLFGGWGGACSGTGTSCTVQLDSDKSVSAAWGTSTGTAQLTVSITGSGHVSGGGINCPSTCLATETTNSAVTLTASPSGGYVFTQWGGACSGTTPTCTVTMTGDAAVTATFALANTLTVNLAGNGAVTGGSGAINCGAGANICSANFAVNATVSLVATPGTGATFTGWSGACGGTATTCTVSMSQSRNVTATFSGGTAAGFTLTVSVTGNGTVTGSGINCGAGATTCTSANHAANSSVTLTATPSAGATFTGWGGGTCTGTTPTCTVSFTANKTVTAAFSGGTSTFPLTVTVTGSGRVSGGGISCGNGASTCGVSLAGGTTLTLTETPASGAKFGGWGGACSGTGATCTVSMTAAKSVTATFTTGGTAGTLTIHVIGRGAVSSSAGTCAGTGPAKTCVQQFKSRPAGTTVTAKPAPGQSFLGWSGACKGTTVTCRVPLTTAQTVTATFTNRIAHTATLTSVGQPIVRKTSTGFNVTLRFATTRGGTAHVRALRAGRTVTSVSAKVAAGRVRVGPFPVPLAGFYTFETRLAGGLVKTRACLGHCGRAAPPPPFVLTREAPLVTRTGDVWSVTLHVRANQIYDGRIRAFRGSRLLVNQHFLGPTGRVAFGPFLLGPGNYTLRLAAVDAYGRARALTWIVSLGR
jgi:uncharacterized repeat protein (TIGR02543 family)